MKIELKSISLVAGIVCGLWFIFLLLMSGSALAQSTLSNVATIAPPTGMVDEVGGCTGTSPPTCSGNNTSTSSVSVWAVSTTKASVPASGSTVVAGQQITYTLSVNVTGAPTASDTVLNDTMTAGQAFGSVMVNGGFVVGGAGLAPTFTLPAGAAVGVHTVSYTATVTAAGGSVGNVVSGGGCTAASCTTTHPVGALALVKTLAGESGVLAGIAEAGETLTYAITISNPTSAPWTDYALTDVLGPGLGFVSADNAGAHSSQAIIWTGLTIPANGNLVVTVKAIVNQPIATAAVRNIAKPTGQPDPACPSAGCVEIPTAAHVTPVKRLTAESGQRPGIAEYGETLKHTLDIEVTGRYFFGVAMADPGPALAPGRRGKPVQ